MTIWCSTSLPKFRDSEVAGEREQPGPRSPVPADLDIFRGQVGGTEKAKKRPRLLAAKEK